jgi:predicted O-linked N-acetylglucosamine transferase (SPINDLY family)
LPQSNLDPPTLSEVIRRLDELRTDVRDMGGRFVSTEIYLLDKQVHDREAKEMRAKQVELEKEADDREKRVQDQAATNRRFLIGIVASPFASALIAWIIAGGFRP